MPIRSWVESWRPPLASILTTRLQLMRIYTVCPCHVPLRHGKFYYVYQFVSYQLWRLPLATLTLRLQPLRMCRSTWPSAGGKLAKNAKSFWFRGVVRYTYELCCSRVDSSLHLTSLATTLTLKTTWRSNTSDDWTVCWLERSKSYRISTQFCLEHVNNDGKYHQKTAKSLKKS